MIDKKLFPSGEPPDEAAKERTFQQYKLAVESWDRVRARRHQSNAFFVTINSTIITAYIAISKFFSPQNISAKHYNISWFGLALLGTSICILWYFSISNYKSLTGAKHKIISNFEVVLPSSPFTAESQGGYHFTMVERFLPIAFAVLYWLVCLVSVRKILESIESLVIPWVVV
jgi:hypothetical protein